MRRGVRRELEIRRRDAWAGMDGGIRKLLLRMGSDRGLSAREMRNRYGNAWRWH